jgi:integrase
VKRKTALPKGVWFQKKRLSTGEVIRYGYFGRGLGMEALGREGSPDFHERLAEVLRRAPQEGHVTFLIWRYKSSAEFAKLRPLTRRDYNRQLDKIQAKFGKLRIAAMNAPEISDHIYRWRDTIAEASPRQADYAISVLAAMLAWCVRRGLVNHNRAAGVPDVYAPDRSEKVWTPEMEARVLEAAPAPIQRAIILAVETGLSQEDLLVLPKSAVVGNVIVTRRLKTGKAAAIPISPRLAEMLAAIPASDSVTLLNKADGRPFDPKGNGLRSLFRAARDAAGVTDRTFNDLRGTFISRRRVMGWTAEETALCSGHPIAGEKGAQGAYVDRAAVALANANRLWERFYGPNSEQKLQTGLQTGEPVERLSH